MKKKYTFFFAALLISSLITSASAHTGGTDANGGHTDSETGEYHYHHGYPAHDHYDMDGDGDIDCPYNFVNAENSSGSGSKSSGTSGTNNASYKNGYAAGKKHGYESGYEDGYDRGYTVGESAGWITGYEDAQTYHQNAATNAHIISSMIGILLCIGLYYLIKRRSAQMALNSISKEKALNSRHEAELRHIRKDTSEKIEKIQKKHIDEIQRIKSNHEQEIANLKSQIRGERRLAILDSIASGEDESIELPNDIRLRPSYIPVKGKIKKFYPYGEYTVFMSRCSNKYHIEHDCSDSVLPLHLFDLPGDAEPCWKCVQIDMSAQPLPEWYDQIRHKLDTES